MNDELRRQLIAMRERDTQLRTALLQQGNLYDGYNPQMEALHLENAERLHDIIQQYGWPGLSLVGKEGASAAFSIAQHAISKPELQRLFLSHLTDAAKKDEAGRVQEACLRDRILFNEGKPQLHGMLFDWDSDGQLTVNVDDFNLADARRQALGLKPLAQALADHRQEIEDEGGGPPKDIARHKQMGEAWARRVGWR